MHRAIEILLMIKNSNDQKYSRYKKIKKCHIEKYNLCIFYRFIFY